jgi:hypothetical protein
MRAWPCAAISRTRSGYVSAHLPVMPKAAEIPFRPSVVRISFVYPASEPASKVRITTFDVVGTLRTTVAGPAGTIGDGGTVAVGGTTVAVGDGVGESSLAVGVGEAAIAAGEADIAVAVVRGSRPSESEQEAPKASASSKIAIVKPAGDWPRE